MKKTALYLIAVLLLLSCEGAGSGNDDVFQSPEAPPPPTDDPVFDTTFWFKEIYEAAEARLAGQLDPTPAIPPYADGPTVGTFTEDTVGQLANCEYVCLAINAKWGTNLQPAAGTEKQAANMEYLLKVVDLANQKRGITTSYGTGSYATRQAADTIAVNQAVNTLIKPGKLFVAVGTGKTAYSADGISWTTGTLAGYWTAVAYGNGKFVAVAGSNYAAGYTAYSADGITWSVPASLDGKWLGVAYGNGKFVAVAGNGKTAYSTNGITWSVPASLDGKWLGVTYGNGKFVAVADDNKTAYSTNGITWTTVSLTGWWSAAAYGNGKFVAVSWDGKTAYSADGITWTTQTLDGEYWDAVAYGNGKFVALSADGGKIAYSTDGISWTTGPFDGRWGGVAYGNGKFVAVALDNKTAYSANGISWTPVILPGYWYGVAYGGE